MKPSPSKGGTEMQLLPVPLRRKVKVGEFEMARLDDLLGDAAKALAGQAGVMKIDVEGYESKVCGTSA